MGENTNKTILVVDDTESNLDMVLAILKDYDVIPCTSGIDALEMVKEEEINLILLDILMPEMDGYTVCTTLKSDIETQEIPIIFITAKTDEESIEKAYEIGGADYVTKPFKPKELLARVKVQLKLQDVIRELDLMATRDALTGIFNRRKFFELGKNMFESSGENLYALMIDIDHFKKVNDRHGHDVGDIVLKKVATVIGETLPENAVFGRMGGEEFSVMFVAETHDQAMDIVSDILKNVADAKIPLKDNTTISCTISIGIGRKYPEFPTLDTLLKEADMTLYEAKESGRNTSIFRDR